MFSFPTAAALATLLLTYVLFKRFTRPSLSVIRGPQSPSFIFGNLLEIFQHPVGKTDFAWQSLYGNVVRFKSAFKDQLLVADPKALQKILNASAEMYPKPPNTRVFYRLVTGKGLFWAEGEDHRRQKSILLPGFGVKECRAFLPIFNDCAEGLSAKWLENIGSSNGQATIINVLDWLSRGALDAIGHAVFDIQFDTVQDESHPLVDKYRNFLRDTFGLPPARQILVRIASKYIPASIFQWVVDNGSNPQFVRARDMTMAVTSVAKELVRVKADALLHGSGNRDILTLLVKANMDATAKKRLSDEELLSQMGTLLIAGHETIANTMSWILLELARHPNVQSRLRNEIRNMEVIAQERGASKLTIADLEAMPYLNAVIKEGLRLHPTVHHMYRIANQDDVLPLSKPILTESGDLINEMAVPKGTWIVVSIAAYNRDKDLWGEDAHEFNPDRWLDGRLNVRKLHNVGVHSNLMTFSSGTRACIGWRFAIIEIQAFLSTLVGKFEFAMTDKAERIVRQPMVVMAPMVEGELDRGVQMPLVVSLAPRDDEDFPSVSV